uniref:Dynactin subunit 6 n=1 Tax=Acrobeloides nanus TaxID=290746 RepID=A0A914C6I2_9BILA
MVIQDAKLVGKIYIGSGTVVHPKTLINAKDGEIQIGKNNIIEEGAVIENLGPEGHVMKIGDDNIFETFSICQALEVGSNNVFGIKSEVGPGVEITDGCSIGAKCKVLMQEKLKPLNVVYGKQYTRRTASEKPQDHKSHLEFLRKVLPNYHMRIKNKEDGLTEKN